MKKTTIKFLAVLLILVMALPLLLACGNTPEETTEKPEETQSPTESESETEGGEIEEPQKPLELIKDGKSEFTLVINKYAQFINDKAAYMIRDAVKEISGAEIPVAKDYDLFFNSLDIRTLANYLMQVEYEAAGGKPGFFADREKIEASYDKSAPYEILIGETDRAESARAIADLKGENEYILRLDGNKIVLVASSNKALIAGAEAFISEYLSAEASSLTIESLNKTETIEVEVEENPEVFFGMTQTEVDEKYAALLDGLFTGNTKEVITHVGVGENFAMVFPDIVYHNGRYVAASFEVLPDLLSGVNIAYSDDGLNWEYDGRIIVRPSDFGVEETPNMYTGFCGLYIDEHDIMYVVFELADGKHNKVAMVCSYDNGKSWTNHSILVTKDMFSGWDVYGVGTPDIYRKDGVWYLTFHTHSKLYTEPGNGGCQICVAYGENLNDLTVENLPILPTEKDTPWSGTTGRRDIFYCDGYYYMVYEVSTEGPAGIGYDLAEWTHMFARSKDMINWEHIEAPLLKQDSVSYGYDGTGWVVIDGELYISMRCKDIIGSVYVKLEPVS